MERTDLLDIVVRQGTTIFELLAGEDQTLLVRRNPFLILNLRLDIVDGVGRLDLESDGLAREGLDEASNRLDQRWPKEGSDRLTFALYHGRSLLASLRCAKDPNDGTYCCRCSQ